MLVFEVCFRVVSRVFQKCVKGYSRNFQGSFRKVSMKFQNFFRVFHDCFVLKVCSCMALIAATRVEGGLVFTTIGEY